LKGILLDIDNHSGDSPTFKKIFSNPYNSLVSLLKKIACPLYSLGQSPQRPLYQYCSLKLSMTAPLLALQAGENTEANDVYWNR